MGVFDRLQHAWNAFMNKDPTPMMDLGASYSYRPDRPKLTRGNDRTIITSVYERLSIDASSITIEHVRLDGNKRYIESVPSGLNNCLTCEANLDQTGRAFIQDVVLSMLDEGVIAIVPTETSFNPRVSNSFDVDAMRTAKILQWYPENIQVEIWDDIHGKKTQMVVPKKSTAIIENPFYSVMNEPNSTMQRLIRKLSLLDAVDEQSSAGKLDLIIQLPYLIKSEARRDQAEKRRKEIENQLRDSKYGIAYTDGTEHITQLNRSLENNLMGQIEYLTSMLYSQLGITKEIMDGTADEKTMNNYYSRTIEPILSAITTEMYRKFLTKTARTQGQSISFFRDPFKLVPTTELADLADKFTRNEIMTSNEMRQVVGMKPSEDPKADELRNKNISASEKEQHFDVNGNPVDFTNTQETEEIQNE